MSLFTRSAVPTVLFAGLFHVAFATVIPSAVIGADDPTQITIKNLFLEPEYNEERIGVVRWSKKSATYYTLQAPAGGGKGRDLVSVDIASGEKKPLVTASEFIARDSTAPQDAVPLDIEDFELSEDETRVLLYTNSRRVWRRNTRGDYWVYDLRKRTLKKLGGDTPASTMMFAKFSPNGRQVAYVHQSNLYVQDVDSLAIQTLTKDGSETIINGTSDWVNEEELNIRDAFRWSPDSQQIVFWQFDTSEVPRLHLVNNTAGKYPELLTFPYPKVGERNSATRIGIIHVGAAFAQTNQANAVRWLNITGDPREHYIPHVEWSPDSKRLIVQQFNRLQTVNRLMQADPQTGVCQEIMAETDSAWLENDNPVRWFDNGRKLVWVSERSGWRHAYSVDLKERTVVPITTGEFDLIEIEAVDDAHGWLYFSASPDQPTERYLYRIRLSGGPMERVTPAPHKGWNTYQIAPSGDWATYAHSSFDSPPTVELIHLADHQTVRVLVDNAKLRARLAQLVEGHALFNGSRLTMALNSIPGV